MSDVIKDLEAHRTVTSCNPKNCYKCRAAARLRKLEAVREAADDYMWCIGDPPAHNMARAKLKKALADCGDE